MNGRAVIALSISLGVWMSRAGENLFFSTCMPYNRSLWHLGDVNLHYVDLIPSAFTWGDVSGNPF